MKKTSLTMALAAATLLLAACGKNEAPAPAPAPAPAAEAPAAAPAPAPAPAPVAENTAGKSVYGKTCAMCHAAGVAGAPKLGDKAAWAPRIQTGMDALYASVVQGKGAMPPRGGSAASEADIHAAVDYMVAAAK